MQSVTEQRLIEAFHTQLGPAIREALECPTVVEVMVYERDRVRLDTIDRGRIETAYRGRARIEQAIGKLKRFKRVALRCEKTKQNFGSFVAIAAAIILVKSVHTA